jgi:hypothetical protein
MNLRTWGRVYDAYGVQSWVEVTTDDNGYNDSVWITTLIQCLKLSIGESPFYANFGIPAQRSVIQQIFPDFYVSQTQSQFAQYFASLIISKVEGNQTPTYQVNIVTHQGAKVALEIAV